MVSPEEYEIPAKVVIDHQAGTAYVELTKRPVKVSRSLDLGKGIVLDLNVKGQIIGIEILSHKMSPPQDDSKA